MRHVVVDWSQLFDRDGAPITDHVFSALYYQVIFIEDTRLTLMTTSNAHMKRWKLEHHDEQYRECVLRLLENPKVELTVNQRVFYLKVKESAPISARISVGATYRVLSATPASDLLKRVAWLP